MYLGACIEWLFADEHAGLPDRIRAAKAAGISAVEFHLWRDKPLEEIRQALDETGVELASFVVEPRRSLVDPAQHDEFLQAVADTIEAAKILGAKRLVVASGFEREGVTRQEQHDAAVSILRSAAQLAEAAGITLLLEPLNTRVEHPGMFLSSTKEGLDIVDEVGSPALKLMYDLYHSTVMGERPDDVLRGRIDRVSHIQIADVPGRQEPGTGTIAWSEAVAMVRSVGFDGLMSLECKPSGTTAKVLESSRAQLGL